MSHILRPLTSQSEIDPVLTEDYVKVQLDLDDDRLDEQVAVWISAATKHAERLRGEVLMPQDWEMRIATFPDLTKRYLRLWPRPVRAIQSITYRLGGELLTFGTLAGSPLTAQEYELIDHPDRPLLALLEGYDWPTGATDVRIQMSCGYASDEEVPAIVKQGMVMAIGHWLENREAVVTGTIAEELPLGVRALLARPKVGGQR